MNRCNPIWCWTPLAHTNRNQRRGLRQRTQSAVERLEDKCLLAASTFTPEEQLILELVNRARADPAAEAALQGIDLNQGLAPRTISTDAKQPLAPNNLLRTAADGHTADMFARGFFAHTSPAPGSTTSSQRVTNAGYPWTRTGENLAIQTYFALDRSLVTGQMHDALYSSSGHRVNFMNSQYFEVGMGVDFGSLTDTNNILGGGVNAAHSAGMTTQNFGTQASQPFVTGVVFTDANDASGSDDSFYTIGEQTGGGGTVTVTNTSTAQAVTETIGAAGGYSLQVPAGTYTVTIEGGGLANTYTVTGVVVGSENVKVDFDTTTATIAPAMQYDFGDAPDPGYPTLNASDGARHVIGAGPFLGAGVDADADGQPNAAASGDTDDGVAMTSGFVQGTLATFDVTASGSGFLNVWFDSNNNGSFDDGGELVLTNQPLVTGSNSLNFSVSAAATPGTTYLRFRFTSQTVASPSPRGVLPDGEVEDYNIQTQLPAPTITTVHNTATADGQFQLTWTAVTGADGYEVWYTNTATGQASFVQETVTTNSFTPSSPLPIARYNIWVRVKQNNGATSPWSVPITVQVNTPVTLNSLAFQQTTLRPTISWAAVNGAARYEIWVNNITASVIQAIRDTNVTSTSFSPTADLDFGLYRGLGARLRCRQCRRIVVEQSGLLYWSATDRTAGAAVRNESTVFVVISERRRHISTVRAERQYGYHQPVWHHNNHIHAVVRIGRR
ncbi:MAG: GEVED domain-containing protein [Fuerstiella sp.]|nr:GEVED domain-containing protein [Fuerstiella sp.]